LAPYLQALAGLRQEAGQSPPEEVERKRVNRLKIAWTASTLVDVKVRETLFQRPVDEQQWHEFERFCGLKVN
jgi:hypothetical protein